MGSHYVFASMLEGVFDCDCDDEEGSGSSMVDTCTIMSKEVDKKECGGYEFMDDEDDE